METNKKKEKGFLTVDLGVAMMVVIIFVTIMTSYVYSLYVASTEAKKTAIALNYAVDIFEYAGILPYANVTADKLLSGMTFISEVNAGSSEGEASAKIGTGTGAYEVQVRVSPQYSDEKIKLISLTIYYKTSNKNTQRIELRRLKTIEVL